MKAKTRNRFTLKNPYLIISFFLLIVLSAGLFNFSGFSVFNKSQNVDSSYLLQLPPDSPISKSEAEKLNSICTAWYDHFLARTPFNGGIVVAKNGHIVFEKYNGQASLETGEPFSENTSTHIASVSKTFTAMAVLKLYQDGKLSLDSPASTFFPGFPYEGVTIKTLLNHRSGLPNYLVFMEKAGWDKSRYIKNTDILDYLTRYRGSIENIGSPDRNFSYCNTNYALLALIIENVSGMPYADYLRRTFFEPLSMTHTFVRTDADSLRMHPSYEFDGRRIPDNFLDAVVGDKNIYSTPKDMLQWDKALRSNVLFKPETLTLAYTPYSNEKPGTRNYGLGWRMYLYPDGEKVIYHNGWWHGNNASFIRLIDENATIIAFGSRFNKSIYKTKELIAVFSNLQLPEEEE